MVFWAFQRFSTSQIHDVNVALMIYDVQTDDTIILRIYELCSTFKWELVQ